MLAAAAASALAFEDGPPERTTGGFGEDSCLACHMGSAENEPSGTFTLSGLPDRFTPGERYTMMLTLSRKGTAVAGFQMTVRAAGDGGQAGTLGVPAQERTRVALMSARGVQYAHHTAAGIEVGPGGTNRWSIQWDAPDVDGTVVVHAAAVAGDGDASQIGDHVYTLERTAEAACDIHR
jgi:hypothetical protein